MAAPTVSTVDTAPAVATADAQGRSAIRFSVVVAAYNVSPYLGDFMASIEAQTFPRERLQVIVVDDGSTDDTLDVLRAWESRLPELVTVVSKQNGGPASARNAGLPHVRGEWVTFTDPDDALDPGYFDEVQAFLAKRPNVMMVATNRAPFSGPTGLALDNPLSRHFVKGANRVRDLNIDSGHFHGHAASSFFRTEELQRQELRFDERLRATFEDGHFCCVYLLRVPKPSVAYLPDAIYHYRKRGDGTSQLDRSWADPGRFTDVPEHGYLSLLREGAERFGRPPTWLQGMVIYELSWFLKMNERLTAPTAAYGEIVDRFHELMAQICALLDGPGLDAYNATNLLAHRREVLQHGYRDEAWHTSYAVVDKVDTDQNLIRVVYRYQGERPEETFAVYSRAVEPVHQKVREIRFFDRTVLYERIVWLPLGTVRVALNGQSLEMRTSDPRPPHYRLTTAALRKGQPQVVDDVPRPPQRELSAKQRAVVRLSRTKLVQWYYRDAWVLIDRVFNADDSAEHLFRHLRATRPNLNAWFVIQRGTPDHQRLVRDGYRRRIVPHGSLRWTLLMLNCARLISSHGDDAVIRPRAIRDLADPGWRTVFLQHGIIKDDLSTWLNRKDLDIFVASTQAEFDSIVGDDTTYRYTTKEVKLTGLPRFDRVLEEGERFPPDRRDLILIAPTWRQWLSESEPVVTGRHSVRSDNFAASQYAREWTAAINSPELKELAERTGLTVALLLHPNLLGEARLETLPHVRQLSFEGHNVQEYFARARVLVTDYSSMFFNAAYIERPIVYFQFDRDLINAGWHTGRHGYFDYERDGFGPVALTVEETLAAIRKTVENGPEPEQVYLDRIRTTFPERDGRCSERVAEAVLASMGPGFRGTRPSVRAAVSGRVRRLGGRALAPVRRRG
jgi:glycosyltransferase involved in cell wall biosynthesis